MYHDGIVFLVHSIQDDLYYYVPWECVTKDGSPDRNDFGTIHMWLRARGTSYGSSDLFHARLRPKNVSYSASVVDSFPESTRQKIRVVGQGVSCVNLYQGRKSALVGVCTMWGRVGIGSISYNPDNHNYSWSFITLEDPVDPYWDQYEDDIRNCGKIWGRTMRHATGPINFPSESEWNSLCDSGIKAAFEFFNFPTRGFDDDVWCKTNCYVCSTITSHASGNFLFKHNEYYAYEGYEELGLLPNLYSNGWGCAVTEAAKNLPNASSNGVANVCEAAKAIIDVAKMFKGDFSAITDLANPKNAWLAWRYSYNTTKADISEYAQLVTRLRNLATAQHVRVGGTYDRGDLRFRATVEYAQEDVIPSDVQGALDQFGLELSAYNAWDLIPYSFVVDWFLHIGDLLERYELYDTVRELTPVDSWYSVKTSYAVPDGMQDVYIRLGGLSFNQLQAPWYYENHTSKKTTLFRCIDGIALFG